MKPRMIMAKACQKNDGQLSHSGVRAVAPPGVSGLVGVDRGLCQGLAQMLARFLMAFLPV